MNTQPTPKTPKTREELLRYAAILHYAIVEKSGSDFDSVAHAIEFVDAFCCAAGEGSSIGDFMNEVIKTMPEGFVPEDHIEDMLEFVKLRREGAGAEGSSGTFSTSE